MNMLEEMLPAGLGVDQFWAARGLQMTMGAEPTYLCASQCHLPEWSLEALGPNKLHLGQLLARRLHERFGFQGVFQEGLGKWYPGEEKPRWALRSIWPARLGPTSSPSGRPVLEYLCQNLALPAENIGRCLSGESQSEAWVLVLEFHPQWGWRSCPWPSQPIELIPVEGPVGLRLPWNRVELPVTTAVCVEGLEVFVPPLATAQAWQEFVAALPCNVTLKGYAPPLAHLQEELTSGPPLRVLSVTPDPGVLEINLQPSSSWPELLEIMTTVDQEARALGLTSGRFGRDGSLLGTGGGCHVVVGGPNPALSPFAQRPDLLRSILVWWNRHPSLSYLFSGQFVGPTSQAPRVDEARHDTLYELELAFRALDREAPLSPDLLGRLFRDLLVDVSGNGHRSEICVDKLFDPLAPGGQQGLLEFRALEMAPHLEMNLALMLLLRALMGRLWQHPQVGPLRRYGTALHDRFCLPSLLWQDFQEVLLDLAEHGLSLSEHWYRPQFDFRFPLLGQAWAQDVGLELRTALEPWPVLGEEASSSGSSRPVDSSLQRIEVSLLGAVPGRHRVTCQGLEVPLHPLERESGKQVAGVRFRVWQFSRCLHPTVGVHSPLTFEVLDGDQPLLGCRYRACQTWEGVPRSAEEAAQRRQMRFELLGVPQASTLGFHPCQQSPEFPWTLDLRWVL